MNSFAQHQQQSAGDETKTSALCAVRRPPHHSLRFRPPSPAKSNEPQSLIDVGFLCARESRELLASDLEPLPHACLHADKDANRGETHSSWRTNGVWRDY